jgi:hypothetical protein
LNKADENFEWHIPLVEERHRIRRVSDEANGEDKQHAGQRNNEQDFRSLG